MQLKKISDDSILIMSDNFVWVDEFAWSSVKQDIQPTMGGGLVVSENTVSAGRPITLESGDGVGVTRGTLKSLMILVNLSGEVFELTLPDGQVFNVIFDKKDNPVSGNPLTRLNVMPDSHPYNEVKLKFLEVE